MTKIQTDVCMTQETVLIPVKAVRMEGTGVRYAATGITTQKNVRTIMRRYTTTSKTEGTVKLKLTVGDIPEIKVLIPTYTELTNEPKTTKEIYE